MATLKKKSENCFCLLVDTVHSPKISVLKKKSVFNRWINETNKIQRKPNIILTTQIFYYWSDMKHFLNILNYWKLFFTSLLKMYSNFCFITSFFITIWSHMQQWKQVVDPTFMYAEKVSVSALDHLLCHLLL